MTLGNQNDHKKKSLFKNFFSLKHKKSVKRNSFDVSEFDSESSVQSLFPNHTSNSMPRSQVQTFRTYVATWNVGGNPPHDGLNLDDLLQIHYPSDIYVLGFQEIVPLNAGNVLVVEDNEPAAKWLSLINQSLNKSDSVVTRRSKSLSPLGSRGSLPFQKPYLKRFSENFRSESWRRLKSCNCPISMERKNSKDYCFWCPQSNINEGELSSEDDDDDDGFSSSYLSAASNGNQMNYSLIMAKQMVGIFLTIWVRKELVQYVGHLRVSCTGRGIMGRLGNKGCISVRMTVHQTSFCFVCSHLASGEREGDELRRNTDVIEILKNTQFRRGVCRSPYSRVPEKILEHDRVIWLGDLNYRIALSYSETLKLVEKNDWGALFDKDQLKIERESGRVFSGWKEGKIYFAPTYKYSYNSDIYAGDTAETKKQRRTPAWCDRILWHGNGIRQLSYLRLESRFSDHRPVCATFLVDVEAMETSKKGCNMKVASEEYLPLKII